MLLNGIRQEEVEISVEPLEVLNRMKTLWLRSVHGADAQVFKDYEIVNGYWQYIEFMKQVGNVDLRPVMVREATSTEKEIYNSFETLLKELGNVIQ